MLFVAYFIPLVEQYFTKEALEAFGDFKTGE
jgi:hypothetical protein